MRQKAPSAEGAVSRRLTEDKPLKLAFLPFVFFKITQAHILPRRLPQKEGDHSRSEWWKIRSPSAKESFRRHSPQSLP